MAQWEHRLQIIFPNGLDTVYSEFGDLSNHFKK